MKHGTQEEEESHSLPGTSELKQQQRRTVMEGASASRTSPPGEEKAVSGSRCLQTHVSCCPFPKRKALG